MDFSNTWQWQLQNSIKTLDALFKHLHLDDSAIKNINDTFKGQSLPFLITPYFASLMGQKINCPLLSQVLPKNLEDYNKSWSTLDPLGEEDRKKAPNLIHRYEDRVLFYVTDRCFSYCRYCTRKRFVGQGPTPSKNDFELAFNYIEQNNNIEEIIFSGGDPLILSDDKIFNLLKRADDIDHIKRIRIHTRVMTFLPMRITDQLAYIFSQIKKPLIFVTHFNHKDEITDQTKKSAKLLQQSNLTLLNQSVFLKDINDSKEELTALSKALFEMHILPYYLHLCDVIFGAEHFRVPLAKAQAIYNELFGNMSGYLIPKLIIDIPGGLGKVMANKCPISNENEDEIYLKGLGGKESPFPKN